MKRTVFWSILFFCIFSLSVTPAFAADEKPADAKPAEVKKENPTVSLGLKNGDQLSGTLQKFEFDEGKIYIKSTQLGDLAIAWKDVEWIKSESLLFFRLEGANIISGRPTGMENGKLVILTTVSGKLALGKDEIMMVGADENSVSPEYIKKVRELKEKEKELEKASKAWAGYINLHFSGNEGTKNDRTFTTSAELTRKTDGDQFIAHVDIRYSSARRENTKNEVEGFLKEDLILSKRLFVWGQLKAKWDEIAQIDLRFDASAGMGLFILKEGDFEMFAGDKITLNWEVGAQFSNTDYADDANLEDSHTGGIVTRLNYVQTFSIGWKLTIFGEYYQGFVKPNDDRDNLDDYTITGIARLEVPITGYLSFTAEIKDVYTNVVPDGTKRNDFYWDIGIMFKF